MSHLPITVRRRLWRNSRTGERTHVITVHQGQLFIRIPIDDSLYDVVNEIHDLAEQHERAQQKVSQP